MSAAVVVEMVAVNTVGLVVLVVGVLGQVGPRLEPGLAVVGVVVVVVVDDFEAGNHGTDPTKSETAQNFQFLFPHCSKESLPQNFFFKF
jgi:hypothetical protein